MSCHIYRWVTCLHTNQSSLCYRVAKTHGMPYFYRSFSATKIPYLVALLREMTCDSRHPMRLCHPVLETVRRVRNPKKSIPSFLTRKDVQFFGFCWYLRINNCVVQIISLLYIYIFVTYQLLVSWVFIMSRGGGLGSRPIFKKFNEPYAPS